MSISSINWRRTILSSFSKYQVGVGGYLKSNITCSIRCRVTQAQIGQVVQEAMIRFDVAIEHLQVSIIVSVLYVF